MYSSYYIFDPPFLPFFVHSNGLNLTDDIFSSWHTTITGPCRALVFSLSLFPFVFYPQWHFSLQPYTSTVMRIMYVLHFRKTFTSFYPSGVRDLKNLKKKTHLVFLLPFSNYSNCLLYQMAGSRFSSVFCFSVSALMIICLNDYLI